MLAKCCGKRWTVLWRADIEVSQASRSSAVTRLGLWCAEQLAQLLHSLTGVAVAGEASRGAPPGVEHRRVVAPAEVPADGGQRLTGELPREVHGELAGPGDACGAARGEKLFRQDSKELAGGRLDLGDGARGLRGSVVWIEAVEHLFGERPRYGPSGEGAECDDADEGALER